MRNLKYFFPAGKIQSLGIWFIIYIFCLNANAQNDSCNVYVQFEDLNVGSTYNLNDEIRTESVLFSVAQLYSSAGEPIIGLDAKVQDRQYSKGTGKEIFLRKMAIKPKLPNGTNWIQCNVGDLSYLLNLKINDEFRAFRDISDIANTSLGGVKIFFTRVNTSNPSNYVGILYFQGNIKSFEIGGLELAIDNFCIGYDYSTSDDCNPLVHFEDLPINSQYNNGSSFISNGINFSVFQISITGTTGGNGSVSVSNSDIAGNTSKKLQLDDIAIKPQLPNNIIGLSCNVLIGFKYLRIKINQELLVLSVGDNINNQIVGGVLISVQNRNLWSFSGTINEFEIGGLGGEMLIDNFCIKTDEFVDCPFEPDFSYTNCSGLVVDDFIDRSDGASENDGFQYKFFIDGQLEYPNDNSSSFNGFLHVFSTFGEHEGRLVITNPQDGCTEEVTKTILVYPETPVPDFTIHGDGCTADGNPIGCSFTIPANSSLPAGTEYEFFWNWINLNNPTDRGGSVGTKSANDPSPISYSFLPPSPGQYQMKLTLQYQNGYCDKFVRKTFVVSTLNVSHNVVYHYCSNTVTGDLSLNVNEGTPPYQYSLNGGSFQSSNSFLGLAPGNYQVTVKDAGDCEANYPVQIIRDESLIPKITGFCASPGPCSEASSSVGVNVKFTARNGNPGSTGNYRYNIVKENSGDIIHSGTGTWNNLQSTVVSNVVKNEQIRIIVIQDLTNRIDVEQCPLQSTVIAIPELVLEFTVITNTPIEVCNDDETVEFTLSVKPGIINSPFFCGSYNADRPINLELQKKQNGSYQTIDSQNGIYPDQQRNFTFSGSGDYRINATYDASGFNCSNYYDFIVKKKSALTINTSTENVSCYEQSNGIAKIDVTGLFVGAISYNWEKSDDPDFTVAGASASGLGPGSYQVTISDQSGCPSETVSFTINEPTELERPVIINPENECGFYAELNTSGTPNYNFIWHQISPREQEFYRDINVQPTGETVISDASVNQPQPGEYYVIVVDANGCQTYSDTVLFEYPQFNREYEIAFRWNSIEMNPPPPEPVIPRNHVTTFQQYALEIQTAIQNQIAECKYNVQEGIAQNYTNRCFSTDYLNDQLALSYELNYDFYTLYYYDRAGNLVRTVSPKGVDVSSIERNPIPVKHNFITTYDYNSLGHRIKTETPDAGTTKYLYNDLGQLRFSQNARQADVNDIENENNETRYTYSKYDNLGRIIEVGEAGLDAGEDFIASLNNKNLLQDQPLFPDENTDEETFSIYNEPYENLTYLNQDGKNQRFLDNRISYTYTNNRNRDKVYTYYSYDPHGNVEWMANKIPQLKTNFIGYEYDLISGNILNINYQQGYPDQFFHKYSYDEDNRITAVYTSTDGFLWDNDLKYTFYDHGPKKSMKIGEYDIQKVDYTYTINGWLKAINTPALSETDEEGISKKYSRDLFGMTLGYYPGDFNRINSDLNSSVAGTSTFIVNNNRPLFNGNISYWVNKNGIRNSEDPFDDKVVGHSYTYDLLGRIKKAENHLFNINGTTNYTPQFETAYSYDKNGNFLSLSRNGGNSSQLQMDDFSYNYYENSNRLRNLPESVSSDSYENDIEAGQSSTDNNYIYDSNGNLIRDNQEGITLRWNIVGKLSEVIPDQSNASDEQKPYVLTSYDAQGQRVKKTVYKSPYSGSGELQLLPENAKVQFYSKRHLGETAAIYEMTTEVNNGNYFSNYYISEFNITGDKRIGILNSNDLLSTIQFDPLEFNNLELVVNSDNFSNLYFEKFIGKKQFEINDHLLNPRVIVSDKKIFHPYSESDQELIAYNNYYPFGSQIPDRFYRSKDYRYGFNGMEKNDEAGSENSYSTMYRQYNPRLGRWLNTEPLIEMYPAISPYNSFKNNPILFNDINGLQPEFSVEDKLYIDYQFKLKKLKEHTNDRSIPMIISGGIIAWWKEGFGPYSSILVPVGIFYELSVLQDLKFEAIEAFLIYRNYKKANEDIKVSLDKSIKLQLNKILTKEEQDPIDKAIQRQLDEIKQNVNDPVDKAIQRQLDGIKQNVNDPVDKAIQRQLDGIKQNVNDPVDKAIQRQLDGIKQNVNDPVDKAIQRQLDEIKQNSE
jgi:RHS repeat-associated protein